MHCQRRENIRKSLNFQGRGLIFFMHAYLLLVLQLYGLGPTFLKPNFFSGADGPLPLKFFHQQLFSEI